jgi:polyadenylate-binding protein
LYRLCLNYVTDNCRTADESALRAKVEEAMNVYDEYVKNKDGEGEKDASKEEAKDEKA